MALCWNGISPHAWLLLPLHRQSPVRHNHLLHSGLCALARPRASLLLLAVLYRDSRGPVFLITCHRSPLIHFPRPSVLSFRLCTHSCLYTLASLLVFIMSPLSLSFVLVPCLFFSLLLRLVLVFISGQWFYPQITSARPIPRRNCANINDLAMSFRYIEHQHQSR